MKYWHVLFSFLVGLSMLNACVVPAIAPATPVREATLAVTLYVIPYGYVNLGVSNVDAVAILAKQLHPEAFQ